MMALSSLTVRPTADSQAVTPMMLPRSTMAMVAAVPTTYP